MSLKWRSGVDNHCYNCCRAPGRLPSHGEKARKGCRARVGVGLVVLKKACAVASFSSAMSSLGSLSPAKHTRVGPGGPPKQPPFLFLLLSQLAVRGTTGREANHALVNRQHDTGSMPDAPQLCRYRLSLLECYCCRSSRHGFMSAAVHTWPCAIQEDISGSAKRPTHYVVRAARLTSNRVLPSFRRALTRVQG
jgi:hypothetical protein